MPVSKSRAWLVFAAIACALTALAWDQGVKAIRLAVLADRDLLPSAFPDHRILFLVHMAAGGIALLVGPFQLWSGLRHRAIRSHRRLGGVYVAAVLASALTAFPLTIALTRFGVATQVGFGLLATAWLACTGVGMAAVWRRAPGSPWLQRHRNWMIRSYALAFAAVTLRIYLGTPQRMGWDYAAVYQVSAWACWIPNLLVAECWIRRRRARP